MFIVYNIGINLRYNLNENLSLTAGPGLIYNSSLKSTTFSTLGISGVGHLFPNPTHEPVLVVVQYGYILHVDVKKMSLYFSNASLR